MKWVVIGTITYLLYLYGKANPEVAAGIVIVASLAMIGFFVIPSITWTLLLVALVGLLAWLAATYWYVLASAFLGLFLFLGALMSIGAALG